MIVYKLTMKIITVTFLILLLSNCAGGNVAKVKFGKKCTEAAGQLQEASYVWFVSKEALKDFDKRINKKNCLNS